MASNNILRLADRIQQEFGIPVDPEKFYRTYVGYHQRAAGACTWIMYCKENSNIVVRGFEPIRKYINRKNRLDISERHFWGRDLYAFSPGEPGFDSLPAERNVIAK